MRLIILFRPILALLFICCAGAQNPTDLLSKAPPDVDEALRARVSKYYQAFVDAKPRRAEPLVAEDSQDFFYNMKKTQLLSFEIGKIEYSDSFTKAKAVVIAETYVMALGFGSKPVKVPITSLWKLVDGQWYWYITEDLIKHYLKMLEEHDLSALLPLQYIRRRAEAAKRDKDERRA